MASIAVDVLVGGKRILALRWLASHEIQRRRGNSLERHDAGVEDGVGLVRRLKARSIRMSRSS